MNVHIGVTGCDSAADSLAAFAQALMPAAVSGLDTGLKLVAEATRQGCPVETGAMRNSIVTEVAAGEQAASGTVAVKQGYAVFVELGTSRGLAARPFLYPAFKANEGNVVAAIADAVLKAGG